VLEALKVGGVFGWFVVARQHANRRRYTIKETHNVIDFVRRAGMTDALMDLLRTGAQQLIASAVEAELAD